MCEFCIGYFEPTTATRCLNVNTTVKCDYVHAAVRNKDGKAEIVLLGKEGAYGIEIDKCPKCGKTLE